MRQRLDHRRVAILVTDGFEQSEFRDPHHALLEAGATVEVISPKAGTIRGWANKEWADMVTVDRSVDEARPGDYDALVLPGGVMNPDQLRQNENAVRFVREMFDSGKPVAAICHGPQVLIDADVVRGRTMTSYPSIRRDLENAGASWVDKPVVVDKGLVTSRTPDDLPSFIAKMIEEIEEGNHSR